MSYRYFSMNLYKNRTLWQLVVAAIENVSNLRVRFPAGTGNFSLHHCIQNGCGAHPASYPMGSKGCFPGGKAAGA
jgi:hypothetical protein